MSSIKWPIFSDKMITNVSEVLKSGKVNQWTGTKVTTFEKLFAEYFGVKHAIANANGTTAIELCLIALNLNKGDEVIVTPRTFIASASSVVVCGGIPVFCDVDLNSQNITLEGIKAKITDKTKGVILVHLAGWPADLEEICSYCKERGLWVIEDCAQSHGAKYNGKYAGTYGDMAAWSFCQDKIITTGGEGGMITTDNTELFKKAWSHKDHGKGYDTVFNTQHPPGFRWLHDNIGTNWRLTEMQASLGIDALEELDKWIKHRQLIAKLYTDNLKNIPGVRVTIPTDNIEHAYYKYYFFIRPEFFVDDGRNKIIKDLTDSSVAAFVGSCGEVYLEKALKYLNVETLANSKFLSETAIMLLCDPTISVDKADNDIKIVIKTLSKYYKNVL